MDMKKAISNQEGAAGGQQEEQKQSAAGLKNQSQFN